LRFEAERIATPLNRFRNPYTTADNGHALVSRENFGDVLGPILGDATVVVGVGDELALAFRDAQIASDGDAPSWRPHVPQARIVECCYGLLRRRSVTLVNHDQFAVTVGPEQGLDTAADLRRAVPRGDDD